MSKHTPRTYIEHPAHDTGDKRICPHTGREFSYCWSDSGHFGDCDQCVPGGPTVAERLSKLNAERQTDAHAKFIQHDAHCTQCGQASRWGPSWKLHMCPEGLALFAAIEKAERSAG